MTNKELYKDIIIDLSLNGHKWGVNKHTGMPEDCRKIKGGDCIFGDLPPFECDDAKQEWLNKFAK